MVRHSRFVTQVADGDTLTLEMRDGTKLRVRLYGIDAQEVRNEKKPGQAYCEEGRWALAEEVLRKNIVLTVLERDPVQADFGNNQAGQEIDQRGDGSRRMDGHGLIGSICEAGMSASSSTRRRKQERGSSGYGRSPIHSRLGSSEEEQTDI